MNQIYKYDDVDIMYWYCSIKIFEFGYSFINLHRIEYNISVAETIINGNKKRLEMLKSQKRQASYVKGMVVCQKDWPMCIYDLDYKYNNIISYLVLRRGEKINFIENYFFDECKKKHFRSKSQGKLDNNYDYVSNKNRKISNLLPNRNNNIHRFISKNI